MDLIKQRERTVKKQERKLLRKRKRFKRKFLKDLKNSYVNNEDVYFIYDNCLCCYTMTERVTIAKEFLDANKITYKITPKLKETIGFETLTGSFKIIFNKDLIKELEELENVYTI